MPKLTLRIDFDADRAIGPGKVKLLEMIDKHGSISEAGRQMAMSYRRAWLLVDSLNRSFNVPVIASQKGGQHGGGGSLDRIRSYRRVPCGRKRCGEGRSRTLTLARFLPSGQGPHKIIGENPAGAKSADQAPTSWPLGPASRRLLSDHAS
jgi:molybdate transport system regulatory protein